MLLSDAVKEKVKTLDISPEEIDITDIYRFFKRYLSKQHNSKISFDSEDLSNKDYEIIKNLKIIIYEDKIEFIKAYYNHTNENYSLNDVFDKMALFETIDGFINSHLNDNCSLISRLYTSTNMVFEIVEE